MDFNINLIVNSLRISHDMLLMVAEIDEFKGAWQHLGQLNPDFLKNLRRSATVESIGSSTRIEGSQLSDKEVEILVSRIDTYTFQTQDEQEVAGYAILTSHIYDNFRAMAFSETTIKHLHSELLKYSTKDLHHRGEYKVFSNGIEAFDSNGQRIGIIPETASPINTPRLMNDLVLWTVENLEHKLLHPLLVIAIFTLIFQVIHPFHDGNGRLVRILTTFLLLKFGYSYVPYSSLENVIEHNKESYYLALRKSQNTLNQEAPDMSAWISFFLRKMKKQKIHLETQVSREKNLSLHLPELTLEVLTLIKEHGKLSVGDIEERVRAPRSTLKKYLNDLMTDGHIARFGKGRATWYELA